MTRISHLEELARQSYTTAEIAGGSERRSRWLAATAAYRVVGRRRNGATMRLAAKIRRYDQQARKWVPVSADTVESLAHAAELFYYLCQFDCLAARRLRRAHGYKRFAALWSAWREYEPDPDRLFSALELDCGIRGMMATVENAEHPLSEGVRRGRLIAAAANKLATDMDISDELRKVTLLWLTVWQRYTDEQQAVAVGQAAAE